MSRIHGRNTGPERIVRSVLHRLGYRFRLQGKVSKRICGNGVLPGKPDIVLARFRTAIFVHGCFWHRHKGCKRCTTPKSNVAFWQNKFRRNIENDKKYRTQLEQAGWRVLVIWECEINNLELLDRRLNDAFPLYPVIETQYLEAAEESANYSVSST